MKYHEMFNDSAVFKGRNDYISARWGGLQCAVGSALSRVLNYLFVLNSGALLASLTYISTKPKTDILTVSIWCFVVGIIAILVHAAVDYYATDRHFNHYREDVDSFYQSQIDWEEMLKKDNKRSGCECLLHSLGWLSAGAFILGLLIGVCHLS